MVMATRSFLSYVFCWHNNESIGCIHITTLEQSARKNSHHMDTIRSHTRTRLTQTHLVKSWWVSATHHAHRPTHTHIWCGIKLSLFESFLIPISDRSCSWWYIWHAVCTNFKYLGDSISFHDLQVQNCGILPILTVRYCMRWHQLVCNSINA